jgi:hypothetical protein
MSEENSVVGHFFSEFVNKQCIHVEAKMIDDEDGYRCSVERDDTMLLLQSLFVLLATLELLLLVIRSMLS